MSDKAVQLLTNLLGIYSPSGKEEEIGKNCKKFHKDRIRCTPL